MAIDIRQRVTASAFFERYPETTEPIELIDGEVIALTTPAPKHQRVVRRFARLVEDSAPNGEVFFAPLDVRLDEWNVPQPDVFWVSAANSAIIGDKRIDGAPDLIIEVLSPGTARHDKTVKFLLYEKHGVREYWIADALRQQLEVWVLQAGAYVLQDIYTGEQSFLSPALGRMVSLAGVFV
jgi:Uma2 family endonuclease